MLQALEAFLRAAGLDVVGASTAPGEVVRLVGELLPDVLVATLTRAPDGSIVGIDLLREAARRRPELKIIALSDEADASGMEEAFGAGASALIAQTALPRDLACAVRQSYNPSIHLRTERPKPSQPPPGGSVLTDREIEVLGLAAAGYSNAEVASRLFVTAETVKFHLSNIYRKLGVTNRTEASLRARQLNLFSAPVSRR